MLLLVFVYLNLVLVVRVRVLHVVSSDLLYLVLFICIILLLYVYCIIYMLSVHALMYIMYMYSGTLAYCNGHPLNVALKAEVCIPL